ncbi:MAG TPA: hypothetical protein VF511_01570, partial [Chthoniobacterales bacterium]
MVKHILAGGLVALGSLAFSPRFVAGPLTSAEVTKIINRVAIVDPVGGDKPAVIRDVLTNDLG